MTDTPKRNRRWFQFRLRTFLIFVALFCVAGGWFGNQVRIVRQREAMAAAPGVDSVMKADSRDNITALWSNGGGTLVAHEQKERLPWIRRWLGDRYYLGVSVAQSTSDDEIADYKRAFPEAIVMRQPPGGFMEFRRRVTQPTAANAALGS
jgi:hypothetical protein